LKSTTEEDQLAKFLAANLMTSHFQ